MARFVMLSLLTRLVGYTALLQIGKLSNRPNLSNLVFDRSNMMINRGNNHKTKDDRSSLVLNFDHGNGIIIEPQAAQPAGPKARPRQAYALQLCDLGQALNPSQFNHQLSLSLAMLRRYAYFGTGPGLNNDFLAHIRGGVLNWPDGDVSL